jgi:hypothetical protein
MPGPEPYFWISPLEVISDSVPFTVGLGMSSFCEISSDLQPGWSYIKTKIDFSFEDSSCSTASSSSLAFS